MNVVGERNSWGDGNVHKSFGASMWPELYKDKSRNKYCFCQMEVKKFSTNQDIKKTNKHTMEVPLKIIWFSFLYLVLELKPANLSRPQNVFLRNILYCIVYLWLYVKKKKKNNIVAKAISKLCFHTWTCLLVS